MASPDTKEIELISQLRGKVSDLNLETKFNTDHFLLRWIRARQHNVELAEKMLREHMIYREENDLEKILSWTPPEILLKTFPVHFLGYDDDNCPVHLVRMGNFDLRKIVEIGEGNNYMKYMDYIFETAFNRMEGKFTREGYPVTQFITIVDQKGLSYRSVCSVGAMDLNMQMTKRFEANYPETMKTVFEINCNAVFAAIFSLVKPLMSKATVDKLQIFSSNESKWKPALLARIPASLLPTSLGGTGDELEQEESPSKQSQEQPEEDLSLEVNVPAGDKLDICFTVEEGNSTITWSFKTEKYDIAFAVNCDGKAYIEKNRVDSHESLQEGTITCETPGDYIFTFDNSYSRLRVKTLTYKIEIRKPDGSKYSPF